MSRPDARTMLRAMRPPHWLKNLLVFAPLIAGHRFGDWRLVGFAGLAFTAFSLAASAGYLLNDVLDASRDRLDPAKHLRPSAAGRLSRRAGLTAAAMLGLGALAFSWWTLSPQFTAVVLVYLVVSGIYSWQWKRLPIADVLCPLTAHAAADARFWGATLLAAFWGAGRSMPIAASGGMGSEAQEALIDFLLLSLSFAMVGACGLVLWGLLARSR